MGRKFPKSHPLDRKNEEKQPKWLIYIICEGEVTEPRYFNDFNREYGNQLVDINIIPKGGGIREVVHKCKEKQEELERTAKREKNSFSTLFRVWGVPDVDEHPKKEEAMNLAKEHNIKIALSNPCFEIWALLHYEKQDRPLNRKEAQRLLAEKMPSYHHEKNPVIKYCDIKKMHQAAVKNARAGITAREAEGSPKGCPSSNVYELTEEIQHGPDIAH